ncbi:MAG TPA: hypothetical protein VFQ53_42740 [Kofleriaceae bacterium]|nr:hypothetical protein [Kofleriaceae bacterium]
MHRALLAVGILVGCDRAERPPTPAPPPRDAAVAIVPIDAVTVSPDAPTVASAPAWIYRELQTGAIVGRHTLTTYTLRQDGKQAALDVETRTTSKGQRPAGSKDPFMYESLVDWSAPTTKHYAGTVETAGAKLVFHLADGADPLELPCTKARRAVATPTAVRRPHPRKPDQDGCSGERGMWVPAAMTKLDVLSCDPIPKDEQDGDRVERYAFAPAPGVEFLYVNDDCVMQGGGYRAIAADGSVGKIR